MAVPLFTALTSRHHARVRVDGERVTVEGLGSMNGTQVSNTPVHGAVELKPGDQIEVGGELLVLWSPSAPTRPKEGSGNGGTS